MKQTATASTLSARSTAAAASISAFVEFYDELAVSVDSLS